MPATPPATQAGQEQPPRRLAIGTLLATGATVAPLVASAGLSLVIAHLYGPRGTGIMSLILNLSDVVLMVFTLGLSSGITYLVSRREWSLTYAAREMRLAAGVLGGIGAVAGLIVYFVTRHTIFKGVTPAMAVILLASLPFAIQWSFAAAAALGRDRYEAYSALEISQSMVILVGGVALTVAFGLTGAVIAFAVANVFTAIGAGYWMRREAVREANATTAQAPSAAGQLRRAARFGIQTWSANLLQLLNYRFDIFILGAVAARASIGFYSIAVSVTALGWILPNAFQTVLFPRVASLDAAAGADAVSAAASNDAAARAVRHSVLIIPPTAVGLAGLVLLVPLIYGHGFEHSVALGFILIPGVTIAGIAKIASAITSGRGFPRYALYTGSISVPITLALYLVLIPAFQATGAAAASSVSYVLTTVVTVAYFKRATSIPLRSALIPSRSDLDDYTSALHSMRPRPSKA